MKTTKYDNDDFAVTFIEQLTVTEARKVIKSANAVFAGTNIFGGDIEYIRTTKAALLDLLKSRKGNEEVLSEDVTWMLYDNGDLAVG